jgi:hypothetical protein
MGSGVIHGIWGLYMGSGGYTWVVLVATLGWQHLGGCPPYYTYQSVLGMVLIGYRDAMRLCWSPSSDHNVLADAHHSTPI